MVPQKFLARSVQLFWRLLDTNRQTSQIYIFIFLSINLSICLYIKLSIYLSDYLFSTNFFSNPFIFETWSVRQQCWILFLLVPKLYIWNLIVKIVKFRDDASMNITWSCIQAFLLVYCRHALYPCEKMSKEEVTCLLGVTEVFSAKRQHFFYIFPFNSNHEHGEWRSRY